MEIKKSARADIEKSRASIFVVALILILSFVYTASQWRFYVPETDINKMLEEMEQDLDLQAMKEKKEMVAAITEEEPHEVSTTTKEVRPEETIEQVQDIAPIETTTNEILIQEEEPVVEEAKIEEVVLEQIQEDSKLADEVHFRTIDELPEFPGGHSAFIKWITDNLHYPATAQKNKIEGKVIVTFIVDAQGAIQDIKLKQGVESEIDLAAMRLFTKMPKWKPGMKNGKPTATMVAVPVNFAI